MENHLSWVHVSGGSATEKNPLTQKMKVNDVLNSLSIPQIGLL